MSLNVWKFCNTFLNNTWFKKITTNLERILTEKKMKSSIKFKGYN